MQVALVDWVGDAPPTGDAIASRQVLEQAWSRYEAISMTGGEVLGCRDLALDGLVPVDFGETRPGAVSVVWGWQTIVRRAEEYFAGEVPT